MENSQAAKIMSESLVEKNFHPEISSDQIWKSLYSHSYTVFFQCEVCGKQFDIDGWFFQFESVNCPNCRTAHTGIFGKLLTAGNNTRGSSHNNCLMLESFEGQELEIHVPLIPQGIEKRIGHIILFIFSRIEGRKSNPWCYFDWSEKKPSVQYLAVKDFNPVLPPKKEKAAKNRKNSIVPTIFLGLLVVLGLSGFGYFLNSVLNLF